MFRLYNLYYLLEYFTREEPHEKIFGEIHPNGSQICIK